MSTHPLQFPGAVGMADVRLLGIGQALGSAAGQSLWSLSDDEVIGRVEAAMRLRALPAPLGMSNSCGRERGKEASVRQQPLPL